MKDRSLKCGHGTVAQLSDSLAMLDLGWNETTAGRCDCCKQWFGLGFRNPGGVRRVGEDEEGIGIYLCWLCFRAREELRRKDERDFRQEILKRRGRSRKELVAEILQWRNRCLEIGRL